MAFVFQSSKASDRIDVTVPASFDLQDRGFSVVAWAARLSSSATNKRWIDVRDSAGNFVFNVQYDNGASNQLQMVVGPGADPTYAVYTGISTIDTWEQYVLTWTGVHATSTISVYKNGSLLTPATEVAGSGTTPNTDGEWVFGCRPTTPDQWLDARLAEFAVYDRVLNSQEIALLQHWTPEKVPGYKAYWPFYASDRTFRGISPHTSTAQLGRWHPDVQRITHPLFILSAPSAVTGDLSISVSDSVTLGESQSVSIPGAAFLSVSETDAITLGESQSLDIAIDIAETDGVTLGESQSLDIAIDVAEVDGITLGEVVTFDVQADIAVTDAVTLGESQSVDMPIDVMVTDALTIGDTGTAYIFSLVYSLSIVDAITIGESTSVDPTWNTPRSRTQGIPAESRVKA